VRLGTLLACAIVVVSCASMPAQTGGDVIGMHDLGPGSKSPITGARPDFCLYCHAPHSGVGGMTPLWNQTLSKQTYTTYTSSTYVETGNPHPTPGTDSTLCLSCHDGSVAVGTTAAYGKITTHGAMSSPDVLGSNLSSSHPFSLVLPVKDSPDLVSTLASGGKTADPTGAVKLIRGNIECTSCHNPHVQAKDPVAQNFLVKDSIRGALCLACHDPNRTPPQGKTNPLSGWFQSIHATATDSVSNLPYPTLAQNACFSCHTDHNAAGAEWLLRGAGDQVCLNCHSGTSSNPHSSASTGGDRSMLLAPSVAASPRMTASLDVASEYAKIGHPIAATNSASRTAVQAQSKARMQAASSSTTAQSACVDCHNRHGAQATTTTTLPPAVRASQKEVIGVSASDGTTAVNPAQNQFEICFVCHGSISRKSADITKYGYMPARITTVANPRNVLAQFSPTVTSSHPVVRVRSSPLPQPSLLTSMSNLNGTTQGRTVGSQIFCTDCHNSDDNREFGGGGPNGPHGSKWTHILERRYEFSQAIAPGAPITNLFPNPDLSVNGPYALCGKCHNLSNIMQNASFARHSSHIDAGFSCSTCHTAHGVGPGSANVLGQRLVDFDVNVVAPNAGLPVSYNRGTNTCTLTCHQVAHNRDGSISTLLGASPRK